MRTCCAYLLALGLLLSAGVGVAAGQSGPADADRDTAQSRVVRDGNVAPAPPEPTTWERTVEVLGSTPVRAILLTVFLLSLWVALHLPGAGLAEALAMLCVSVLLVVPMMTGYAQWWEVLIVVAGLCLIGIELFLIPGFGFTGVAGILMVVCGLVLTFVVDVPALPGGWRAPEVLAGVQSGLLAVVVSFATSGLLAVWLRRYLPKLPLVKRLVLATPAGGASAVPGPDAPLIPGDVWPFVGTVGRAVSDLRPGGSAEFPYADDRRVTAVVSESGFISAGTKVGVREVHGNRVVVRPVA